jgi:adenosylmethionine-8-amino-7-oxononanoate aminotransferase
MAVASPRDRAEPGRTRPDEEFCVTTDHNLDHDALQEAAKRHLWMHFTRLGSYAERDVPVMVRGEGSYVWDSAGRRYLDGLSGLFVSQIGHGRQELGEAAAKQSNQLAYFPIWSYGHPAAIELAERLAARAPGDLNRLFFTTGGSEAVESAWKLARQYFKMTGQPGRHKVISRQWAYHGVTMGALSITGVPAIKAPFEPLVPGAVKVPNAHFFRATDHADDEVAYGQWAADQIERALLMEGPESVAAVFLEPVQNSGGSIPPPPGYFQRVREICDKYGVLLVSDEVICAFGRLGHTFGAERYGYQPDMITFAKGVTSGYAPLGGVVVSDRIAEPFQSGTASFVHGITFGGHPVSCAVALANLEVFDREDLLGHVRTQESALQATLDKLRDLPMVADVRGAGYFWALELVKDKNGHVRFEADERERLLRGFLGPALLDAGLIARADDRGDSIIQLAPTLISEQSEFDEIEQILRAVLTKAQSLI